MFKVIFLLFLSFVASPSLFVKRFEKLKNFYDQISVYRAIIGVVYVVFSLLNLIELIVEEFHVVDFVTALLTLVVGFLIGFQWIAENIFKNNEDAKAKLRQVYYNLLPFEGAMAMGVLAVSLYYLVLLF